MKARIPKKESTTEDQPRKKNRLATTLMNNVNDIEARGNSVSRYSLFGPSAMTFPDKISTVRSVMAARHMSQRVPLINPEFPYMFTGAENEFGERSSWNIRVGNDEERKRGDQFEFMKAFKKFKDSDNSPVTYIFRNLSTGKFKAIVVRPAVNLTEKYGFSMDNNIERTNTKIGAILPADFNVSQSSSYVDNNYCAGRNIRMGFAVLPELTEDAGVISDYVCDIMRYNFVDKVDVELKKDDFLLNNYGSSDEDYQAFPHIGEKIRNGMVCSIRENSFISSTSEARIPHILDKNKFSNGTVVDIDIYTNVEVDNEQFNYYKRQIEDYYNEIYAYIHPIIKDDFQDDTALMDIYRQAEKYINKSVWTTKEHIVDTLIRFWVLQPKDIHIGQKFVGRYGNKFVVSKIVPRELMPKTDDGRPIDMLANGLAIPNRIIAFASYESKITFQAERMYQHILEMHKKNASRDDIMEMVIEFVRCFNFRQADEISRLYYEDQNETYRDIIDNGIYIMIPPLDEVCVRDAVLEAGEKFKDIMKPYKIYDKLRHRWVELDGEYEVGYQYTWCLKQEPSKALSAIATGRCTLYDQPVKTKQYNKHYRKYSDNPIKFGEYDTLNFLDGVGIKDFAKITTYFRGSQYEENSVLMSQLEGKKIDLSRYNKFPQLDNLKAVFKLAGFALTPDTYGMKSMGAPIDEEREVLINNVKVKISIPDLTYCLQMYSYYVQYETYLDGVVDMIDFVDHILETDLFHKSIPDWYVQHVIETFPKVLPLLQQLKEYC